MHIQDPEQKSWIQERMEAIRNQTEFTSLGKKTIYERLVSAENFEQFLHKKYVGTKRFGMDGAESIIPALEQILKRGSQLNLQEVVIGMSHRGRLNVLHNVLSKPFRAIISEFLATRPIRKMLAVLEMSNIIWVHRQIVPLMIMRCILH